MVLNGERVILSLTLTHLAEDHMLAVEVRRGHRGDEELGLPYRVIGTYRGDEELGLPCGGRPR